MQDPALIDEQVATFHRAARANERHDRNARVAAGIFVTLLVLGIVAAIFIAGAGVGVLIGGLR